MGGGGEHTHIETERQTTKSAKTKKEIEPEMKQAESVYAYARLTARVCPGANRRGPGRGLIEHDMRRRRGVSVCTRGRREVECCV